MKMNSGVIQKLLMGSRRFGAGAKRFLGHSNNAIKLLGSTTKAVNKLGYNSPALNKFNSFAQEQVAPFIQKVDGIL
jgi:hypothetical protein